MLTSVRQWDEGVEVAIQCCCELLLWLITMMKKMKRGVGVVVVVVVVVGVEDWSVSRCEGSGAEAGGGGDGIVPHSNESIGMGGYDVAIVSGEVTL